MAEAAQHIPVGRLAPSPTGFLHLGHARSFLLAWWHIRARQGRIVLRVEDLDTPRIRPGSTDALLRDLEWLGLDWDGSPFIQSLGIERILSAGRDLLRAGDAYACVCSRSDVRAASAPQPGDDEPRYPGTCRGRYVSLKQALRQTGRQAGVRFCVSEGPVVVDDALAGERRYDVAKEAGDFLIVRREGTPAYQLAVVVDDAHQGVTEVMRGDDLLPSAARQYLLQKALCLRHPRWYHVPLVVDGSGRRLAKRHGDITISELKSSGVDPRKIVAWAARTSGLEVSPRVTAREVINGFDLQRLPLSPVVLDAQTIAELKKAR